MSPSPAALPAGAGLCRLTVHGPGRSFDLAVPTDIQLADLLPTIVGHAGDDLDESGLAQGGWVLQRLGQEPLSPAGTASTLELHDGSVLYLRPQQDALPAVHFDDLVDGVMSSLTGRSDTWRPELSRRLLISVMSFVLAFTAGGLLLAVSSPLAALNGAVIALVLLAAAAAASRAYGDAGLGHVLAVAGAGYGVLAVAVVIAGGTGVTENHARLLAGGMAVAAGAAVGFAATGAGAPLYLGLGTAGLLIALAGALAGLSYQHTAAVVAIVTVVLLIFVPGWAFWLSGLRLPPLPANAEQLQEGIDPHPSEAVIRRSAVADAFLTGLLAALGLVLGGAVTELAITADGPSGVLLCGSLSGLAVLHGRTLGGAWQRLAVVIPGLAGAATLTGRYVLAADGAGPLVVINLLWIGALGLALASRTIPGRRMIPHWARAGEIAHTTLAVSLLPLLLLNLGFFTFLRGIGG